MKVMNAVTDLCLYKGGGDIIMSVVSDIGIVSSLENVSLHAQLELFSVINAMQCFAVLKELRRLLDNVKHDWRHAHSILQALCALQDIEVRGRLQTEYTFDICCSAKLDADRCADCRLVDCIYYAGFQQQNGC